MLNLNFSGWSNPIIKTETIEEFEEEEIDDSLDHKAMESQKISSMAGSTSLVDKSDFIWKSIDGHV